MQTTSLVITCVYLRNEYIDNQQFIAACVDKFGSDGRRVADLILQTETGEARRQANVAKQIVRQAKSAKAVIERHNTRRSRDRQEANPNNRHEDASRRPKQERSTAS